MTTLEVNTINAEEKTNKKVLLNISSTADMGGPGGRRVVCVGCLDHSRRRSWRPTSTWCEVEQWQSTCQHKRDAIQYSTVATHWRHETLHRWPVAQHCATKKHSVYTQCSRLESDSQSALIISNHISTQFCSVVSSESGSPTFKSIVWQTGVICRHVLF